MARFTKGKTFTSTEEVTSAKLHQLVEDASIGIEAITDLTAIADPVASNDNLLIADTSANSARKVPASNFLTKNSGGNFDTGGVKITGLAAPTVTSDAVTKAYADALSVAAGNLPSVSGSDNGSILVVSAGSWATTAASGVSSAQIVAGSVTTAKIADDAVTTAKVANDAITTAKILDANVTTAKIADSAITTAKIAAGAVITADLADAAVTSAKIASGVLPTFGIFRKADPTIVAWEKTGNFTARTATTIYVEVNGELKTIAASTSITMPASATVGTDYAIWAKTDGSLEATTNHTSPPTSNARRVGGFHYAPGGNASGTSGGDATASINAYSFWDLKFRPSCSDPRGMTLVAGNFWADIYLCGVDHHTNGTSKYNVTIADGSAPPKVPTAFGGNGSTAYSNGNWWNFMEVLASWGKRGLTYAEFAALAYGTTEATSSGGSDVPTTGVDGTGATSNWNVFTSKWGVIQSTGCIYTWGDEFGGGAAAASWSANTGGRGSTYQMENAVILGGSWDDGSNSGSRCSYWYASPTFSNPNIGVRGACDHLCVD